MNNKTREILDTDAINIIKQECGCDNYIAEKVSTLIYMTASLHPDLMTESQLRSNAKGAWRMRQRERQRLKALGVKLEDD